MNQETQKENQNQKEKTPNTSEEKIRWERLSLQNVDELGHIVAEIYQKTYPNHSYPLDFVYHAKTIKHALENPHLDWHCLSWQEKGIAAIMSLIEEDEMEVLGMVVIPEAQGKGYASTQIFPSIREYLTNYINSGPYYRILSDIQITAYQNIVLTLLWFYFPLGFFPLKRKITTHSEIRRASMYFGIGFSPLAFERIKQEYSMKQWQDLLPTNLGEKVEPATAIKIQNRTFLKQEYLNSMLPSPIRTIPECLELYKLALQPLSDEQLDIELYQSNEMNQNDTILKEVKKGELIPMDDLIVSHKQHFSVDPENEILAYIVESDYSVKLIANCRDRDSFNQILKEVINTYPEKEYFEIEANNVEFQRILYDKGFRCCGFHFIEHKFTSVWCRISSFTIQEAEIIKKTNEKSYQNANRIFLKHYQKDPNFFNYLLGSKQFFDIANNVIDSLLK